MLITTTLLATALMLSTLNTPSTSATLTPVECRQCTCGVARGSRVVGGTPLSPGEFPWLAALLKDGKVVCGATVVARDRLVTATHCVNGVETSKLKVLVGQHNINKTSAIERALEVVHIAQHPNFNRYTYDNDIAVLKLANSLPDRLFRPACLPDIGAENLLEGSDAVVSGWGSTIEKGPTSTIPMKAQVQIWPQEECSSAGYGRRKVTPRMLCANAPDRDACNGDSGGPLLISQPHYTLVGVVSWGRGCARQGYPGVYTRVDQFLPWLRVALRNACLCSPPSLL